MLLSITYLRDCKCAMYQLFVGVVLVGLEVAQRVLGFGYYDLEVSVLQGFRGQ